MDVKCDDNSRKRISSIELLRIISMIMICSCHVIAELTNTNYIPFNDFVVDWSAPGGGDLNHVVLSIIHQWGLLGNTIFFICSSWFLLEDNKVKINRVITLIIDIEVISGLFLVVYLIVAGDDASLVLGIKMLFPHTFRLFWYLTAYIILYLIHGHLNNMIRYMSKRKMKVIAIVCTIYIVYSYFTKWYFSNVIISWILLYFLIGYIKIYIKHISVMTNIALLIIGIIGIVLIPIILNYLYIFFGWSVRLNYFDDISRWNPFHIMVALAIFYMAFSLKRIEIPAINTMALLSPLVFIIHSNRVVREYFIPLIWHNLYREMGVEYIVIKSLLFGVSLYLISLLMSIIYKNTIQKYTKRISVRIAHIFDDGKG